MGVSLRGSPSEPALVPPYIEHPETGCPIWRHSAFTLSLPSIDVSAPVTHLSAHTRFIVVLTEDLPAAGHDAGLARCSLVMMPTKCPPGTAVLLAKGPTHVLWDAHICTLGSQRLLCAPHIWQLCGWLGTALQSWGTVSIRAAGAPCGTCGGQSWPCPCRRAPPPLRFPRSSGRDWRGNTGLRHLPCA